jgi:hypothetical protein
MGLNDAYIMLKDQDIYGMQTAVINYVVGD